MPPNASRRRRCCCTMMSADGGIIPIRNVYALLAYACRWLDLAPVADAGAIEADTPADLLARLLADGLRTLHRRGPYRAYIERIDDLRQPRGAVDVTPTVTGAFRARGRVVCRFDELSYDVVENRILKAAARALFACRGIDRKLALALRDACVRMDGVSDVALSAGLLRRARAPRGHRLYRMLLDVCKLVFENLLPDESGDGMRLRDFTRDDRQMAHLFEAFVRGFLKRHLDDAHVGREQLRWLGASGDRAALHLLPRMETDVSVRTPGHCAIVETKFVRRPFRELEGTARLKLRSEHLYQLFAYVKNNRERGSGAHTIDGILLYASVGRGVSETLALGNSRVSVLTLDLAASWPEISRALLALPVRRSAMPTVAV
jgi:5-methylcytosine-specific restriction enzyme subunit McrC